MTFSVDQSLRPALPRHWELHRLKEIADVIPSNVDKLTVEGQRPVQLCNYVDAYKNDRITVAIDFMKASATSSQIERLSLSKGDLVITKDSESPWDIAVPAYVAEDIKGLVCGYHLAKISPDTKRVDGGFLAWALRAKPVNLQFALAAQGITRYGLSAGALADGRVPCPPLSEQNVIASYLDAETARIDALVDEKEQCMGLLLELRASVVREMTAGCDVAGPRTETGNQFMPSIPKSWTFVPIGRHAKISNGSTPLKDNADFWVGGTYPWLNSSVVNGDEVSEGSEFVTEKALRQCHLPIVPAGNVVVALTGQGKTRGQASVLRIEATINQHLAAILADPEIVDGEYLFWVLTGQYAALRMVSDGQGGTKGALTCEELGRFHVPLPALAAQKSIAARLYKDTRQVDELMKHLKLEIELLHEFRSSTITDAVLGRIDVYKRMSSERAP